MRLYYNPKNPMLYSQEIKNRISEERYYNEEFFNKDLENLDTQNENQNLKKNFIITLYSDIDQENFSFFNEDTQNFECDCECESLIENLKCDCSHFDLTESDFLQTLEVNNLDLIIL
jgi:hypothetical protein